MRGHLLCGDTFVEVSPDQRLMGASMIIFKIVMKLHDHTESSVSLIFIHYSCIKPEYIYNINFID